MRAQKKGRRKIGACNFKFSDNRFMFTTEKKAGKNQQHKGCKTNSGNFHFIDVYQDFFQIGEIVQKWFDHESESVKIVHFPST